MKANAAKRRAFTDDDVAILQVLESIMAAMILLGAILFVTLSANPVQDRGAPGINLGSLAEDTLGVLQRQPGVDDANISRLEEVVNLAMQGDIEAAEDFLDDIVPQGTRYTLRLDNGIAPLQLVPALDAALSTPRDASGAAVYFLSDWTTYSSPVATYTHGQEVDFSTWTSINGPDGSSVGPGGKDWVDLWATFEPGQDVIPPEVPFGVWRCGGCSNTTFQIVMVDGTAVDRPMYAVQMLLWDGV